MLEMMINAITFLVLKEVCYKTTGRFASRSSNATNSAGRVVS